MNEITEFNDYRVIVSERDLVYFKNGPGVSLRTLVRRAQSIFVGRKSLKPLFNVNLP